MIIKTVKVSHKSNNWADKEQAIRDIVEQGSSAYVDAINEIKATGLVDTKIIFDKDKKEVAFIRKWEESALADFEAANADMIREHREQLLASGFKITDV